MCRQGAGEHCGKRALCVCVTAGGRWVCRWRGRGARGGGFTRGEGSQGPGAKGLGAKGRCRREAGAGRDRPGSVSSRGANSRMGRGLRPLGSCRGAACTRVHGCWSLEFVSSCFLRLWIVVGVGWRVKLGCSDQPISVMTGRCSKQGGGQRPSPHGQAFACLTAPGALWLECSCRHRAGATLACRQPGARMSVVGCPLRSMPAGPPPSSRPWWAQPEGPARARSEVAAPAGGAPGHDFGHAGRQSLPRGLVHAQRDPAADELGALGHRPHSPAPHKLDLVENTVRGGGRAGWRR